MFWDKKIELLSREELESLKLARLNRALERATAAPFYKEGRFKSVARGLKSLREITSLPFTTKEDLRARFPYGFLAVAREKIVRLHSSSGTTGNPTVVFHTAHDIAEWQNLMARSLFMAGARPGDVFQNTMGYGLFTGGLGMHYGAEKIGMLTIPIGPGNMRRQIWFMREFRTTALHVLPSYALRLAGGLAEAGIDPRRDLALRLAFIGAEPHTEEVRRKIEAALGLKAYNCYGLSEMCGPGVAFECPEQNGLHLWEDQFLAEIIDPETGSVLPAGEEGELVLTTLNREAMPLIRYRTRDLTAVIPAPCPCGRTHARLRRVKGRNDDMLIINGVNLFPLQVEQVLMKVPEVGDNYLLEIHKDHFMDKLIVKVEVRGAAFPGRLQNRLQNRLQDRPQEWERLERELCSLLKAEILITPTIKLLEPGGLPQADGKAQRVMDLRETKPDPATAPSPMDLP